MTSPLLFIIFNRKDIALRTLAEIRKARPKTLYIAGDGARLKRADENTLVNQTRKAVLEAIDWDCKVHTLFQNKNLGCGPGVFSAINWFLKHEKYGVILEDDCVPLPSFFTYCDELLERYEDDDRIAGITGFNPLKREISGDSSYYFSKYMENWGWATWRRAWKHMEIHMDWLGSKQENDIVSNAGFLAKDVASWRHGIELIKKEKINSWDIQWSFTVASQNQLTIYPKYNLISNIGFGDQATHTGELSPLLNFQANRNLEQELVHPQYVVPNYEFDRAIYRQRNHLLAKMARYFPDNAKQIVKKILNRIMN